jgi:hypothetical protein
VTAIRVECLWDAADLVGTGHSIKVIGGCSVGRVNHAMEAGLQFGELLIGDSAFFGVLELHFGAVIHAEIPTRQTKEGLELSPGAEEGGHSGGHSVAPFLNFYLPEPQEDVSREASGLELGVDQGFDSRGGAEIVV